MKTINITIEGNSLLTYISFFDAKIKNKLKKMEVGDYDFIDFVTENKKKELRLGRGFCMGNDPILTVLHGEIQIYNGHIFYNNNIPPDVSVEEMKRLFKEEQDIDFDNVISNAELKPFTADSHFFSDANKFKYCSLETVECFKSRSTITISVKNDFRLSDLKVRMIDADTGKSGSISDLIWNQTGLQEQVYGIEYEGNFYEFEGGEDVGGSNQIFWFENNKGTWSISLDISGRVLELGSEWKF